jgi:CBS domain-containing protein
MSPRAAVRLEHLGFRLVYDYVPGKTDWMAAGLPREGHTAGRPVYAGDVARKSVPTCHFRERASVALEAVRAAGEGFSVVTDEHSVVLGLLEAKEEHAVGAAATAADLMRPGPTTVRASEPLHALIERMKQARVGGIPVTDPEGRLLGFLVRQEGEQALRQGV